MYPHMGTRVKQLYTHHKKHALQCNQQRTACSVPAARRPSGRARPPATLALWLLLLDDLRAADAGKPVVPHVLGTGRDLPTAAMQW